MLRRGEWTSEIDHSRSTQSGAQAPSIVFRVNFAQTTHEVVLFYLQLGYLGVKPQLVVTRVITGTWSRRKVESDVYYLKFSTERNTISNRTGSL